VWSRLEDCGVVVREWKVDPATGELGIEDLKPLLGDRTRMVAFTHCSNVIATIHPVREIVDLIHAAGAFAVVDGVSYCPHGMPDIPALGADVYLFSLYKVYGPHIGAMFIRDEINRQLPYQGHFFNADKAGARFTPTGPDHAQIAAVNGVVDYMDALSNHHGDPDDPVQTRAATVRGLFREHENHMLQPFLDFLEGHPAIRLLGSKNASERAPTVAFSVKGRTPADLAARLGERGLGVGAGNYYAWRLLEAMGIDPAEGVMRASFVHYTHPDEVERLIDALDELS
jgi:selenocysteine lyase/cysteine desulfurase